MSVPWARQKHASIGGNAHVDGAARCIARRAKCGTAILLLLLEALTASVAFGQTIQVPDMRDRLVQLGAEPGGISPEAFDRLIRDDIVKWGKVVKDLGITAD